VALVMLVLGGCVVIRQERSQAPTGQRSEDIPDAEPLALEPEADRHTPGSLGWALLSSTITEVVVEVARAGGARAAGEALDALEAKLRQHGGKQSVRRVETAGVPVKEVYSVEDLRTFASEHRQESSGDGKVAIYALVLPGRFEREGVPGVSFGATTLAVFPEEVDSRLPPGANAAAFQTAVVVHELGHLFGLVNLTGQGDFHQAKDHPGHSSDEDSPMHWAVESASILDVFGGGPPTDFTEADRREMNAIREKTP
jgi:hypothetical protein